MIIKEGSSQLEIFEGKVTKKLPVFYNPIMKLNRDVTVLLLNSVPDSEMQIADPLAGSGIRSLRFLKELKKGKIKNISINDYKTAKNIQKNLKLNKLGKDKRITVVEKDANLFLLESKGFDYIDIDPFGTPCPFLESAIVRVSRGGILGITATDTSALAGNSQDACIRKYWAKPLKNEFMHETAIRILIRKVQLMGSHNEKALVPIFSFAKEHYYRVFFRCEKGRLRADKVLNQHKFILYNWKTCERKVVDTIFNKEKGWDFAGPIWTGQLWDKKLVLAMLKNCPKENKELHNLITIIKDESRIDTVGFYDLHVNAKVLGKQIPKMKDILSKDVARTHFLGYGVRTKSNLF
ncbi:MAG: tRNA (guanine(26)-N(2))-dimethyltransferase [archaeon]